MTFELQQRQPDESWRGFTSQIAVNRNFPGFGLSERNVQSPVRAER